MAGQDVFIEDLNSTNGTYINGKPIKRQQLRHLDTVEIGKYKIRYLVDDPTGEVRIQAGRIGGNGAPASVPAAPLTGEFLPPAAPAESAPPGGASIKVLNGPAAGRAVVLTKVVTTVGKPGVLVAAITKRPQGYVLAHVEGMQRPCINGVPVSGETAALSHGDLIELAGTQVQFLHD